jgi:hypothetical protein
MGAPRMNPRGGIPRNGIMPRLRKNVEKRVKKSRRESNGIKIKTLQMVTRPIAILLVL